MGKRRKKGEGSVRQRKDGRWEGRGVVGYDEKGLPRTKNVLAKTKRECQEKLKQLRETVTGSKTEKVRPEMPFGEWLDFWYQNYVKPQSPRPFSAAYPWYAPPSGLCFCHGFRSFPRRSSRKPPTMWLASCCISGVTWV